MPRDGESPPVDVHASVSPVDFATSPTAYASPFELLQSQYSRQAREHGAEEGLNES